MEGARAAAALLVLAACIASLAAAPVNEQTGLDLYDAGAKDGCYYNFQHYGEGDRIMTNEPCLNCTCHNRMLMCYLRVCPFTKPVGQDCTIEKRGDQCCPVITCPDVHVDLLTSTSTTSPAEYGSSDVGHLEKYGCSLAGKFYSEGSKMPSTPNKPCELCYCIRNMTACVMQECTLHVDGCTPVYHKDVCCPVRYSCDHPQDEVPMLDDLSTTVRPTTGFLLTTTVPPGVTQDCVHQDEVFPDGALIKTEKACEHCYCMKGDIVCVVQECGTPMENEGKNCTSMPPRQGQCCPDTYICEGDTMIEDTTNELLTTYIPTQAPTRRSNVEGSGDDRTNTPLATTQSPLTEGQKEGSGFGSGETTFPDGMFEETSHVSLPEPSVTFETLNTGISDITTESHKTADTVQDKDSKLPKTDITPVTEMAVDKEILPGVHEEPAVLITTVAPTIIEPSLQETTEKSGNEETPKITEQTSDFEKEIAQSSTPQSVDDIQLTEKVFEKTTVSSDEYTTEKYFDKSTTAPNLLDQTTQTLSETTEIKHEKSTEKDLEYSTIQEVDRFTDKMEEPATNKAIVTSSEMDIESNQTPNDHSPESITEDIIQKLNEITADNVYEITTKKFVEQTTQKLEEGISENINKPATENIADVTSETIDKQSTPRIPDESTEMVIAVTSENTEDEMSTQNIPERSTEMNIAVSSETIDEKTTEKAIENTSELFNEKSPEITTEDTRKALNEQAKDDITEITYHVLGEQSTEKVSLTTTETVSDDTKREQTTTTVFENTSKQYIEPPKENEIEEITETVFEHSTLKATEKTTDKFSEPSTLTSVEETSEKLDEQTIPEEKEKIPNEYTTESVAQLSSETIDQKSTEKVIESTSEQNYEQSTENISKESSEHPGEPFTYNVIEETTEKVNVMTTEKIIEQSIENIHEPSTEKSAENTTKPLEEPSTAVKIPETSENLDKKTTQKLPDETMDKVEKSTETIGSISTETYNTIFAEDMEVKSTENPEESFTESSRNHTTEKIDQLLTEKHETITEKITEPSTNKIDEPLNVTFAEQNTTPLVSLSEGSSVTNLANQGISSTEGYDEEGSGEPTSVENTEKPGDNLSTTSIKPLDESVSSSEKADEIEITESTPTRFVDSYTTNKVIIDETEPETQTIYESKKPDNELTTQIPSILVDNEQTKVTAGDSYTALPETTENVIDIKTEVPQIDGNFTVPHGIAGEKIESSSLSNEPIEKESTEVTKQESVQQDLTTVFEHITQTETTINEIVTTEKTVKIATNLPTDITITTVQSDPSLVSSEPTLISGSTELSQESTVEPIIPTKETTEADKENNYTQQMEEEGTLKPDLGGSIIQSGHPTVSSEPTITTTEINILSSSTELTDRESVQPTTITESTAVTLVPDESENEIHEDEQTIGNILPHIPGEGDCLVDGKTYSNDSFIPSTNKCQSSCKCVSSIVKCDQIQCSPPPENMINCQPMYDAKESCCPTYVCDHSKETVAPESHNQMLDVTTELTSAEKEGHTSIKPDLFETTRKPQCDFGDCHVNEEVIVPVIVPECSADSCGPTRDKLPVPHRSSDEHPSGGDQIQLPDCSSGICSQEPGLSPNLPNIPVVIATPEECHGDVCTPTIKDESEQPHESYDIPAAELPVSVCSGDSCQQSSGDCKSGDCETPLEKQPEAPSCSGEKCDLPKSPEILPNVECESDDCNKPAPVLPGLQSPVNTQCTGDGCISLSEEEKEEPCQSGHCENPTQATPELHESGGVSCEGNCDVSQAMVPETSLNKTCKEGQCESVEETTNASIDSICTGDDCGHIVTSGDASEEPCNGIDCLMPISKSPESITSAPCEGQNCGSPQTTESQPLIPEACQNGDCRRTDNITPTSQSPLDVSCNGDQCEVQQSTTSKIPDPEKPVGMSCTGDLCNLPPAISPEIILSEDCKEGDCKDKPETQKINDSVCTGNECIVVVASQTESTENEATSTIVPYNTSQESGEFTKEISIETSTHVTENYETKITSSLPNVNIDLGEPSTQSSVAYEKETKPQTSLSDSGSAQTESTSSPENIFTLPSDTKISDITTDFIDHQMTTANLPQTVSSEVTKLVDDEANISDVTTLETLLSSTEKPSYSSDDKIEQTSEYENISTITEKVLIEEPITEGETNDLVPKEPSNGEISTENNKSDQITSKPEVQQSTATISDITEKMQQPTVEPDKVGKNGTEEESSATTSQEMTTAYSVELEQHTHAPSEEYTPIEQEGLLTTEQVPKIEEPELTTMSIIREQDQPEVHSHTVDAKDPQTYITPGKETINPTMAPESPAVETTSTKSVTSEIIPEVSTQNARVPTLEQEYITEISTDNATPATSQKEVVETVTEKEKHVSVTSDNTDNVQTSLDAIAVTESVTLPAGTEIPNDAITIHSIPEKKLEPVTDLSKPSESSTPTLVISDIQSEGFTTTTTPDAFKEPVEESSTKGAEKDIMVTQYITENTKLAEEVTTAQYVVTKSNEQISETTSIYLGGDIFEKTTVEPAAQYPDLSTTKSVEENIITVLPVQTSTSIYAQNTNAPIMETENVSTEPSEISDQKYPDRKTTISDGFSIATTPLSGDVLNKFDSEGADKTKLPDEIQKVPTTTISDILKDTNIAVTDNALFITDAAEELTENPQESNEIPKGETDEEDHQLTTASISKLDEQSETVTQTLDVTSTSQGESLSDSKKPTSTEAYTLEPSSEAPTPSSILPTEEEGSGQSITTLKPFITEDAVVSHDINTSSLPLTTEDQDLTEKQSTVLTDFVTVKVESTTLLAPTITTTNENTIPTIQKVQPDATTEHATDNITTDSDRSSTAQDLDKSNSNPSEQTTEQLEPFNLTTIGTQLPTTIESMGAPITEQEPIQSDAFDKKPTSSVTEITPGEVSSSAPEQADIPTTPKVESEHEHTFSTDDSKTTAQPFLIPDVQSNDVTEKPDSDDKIQSTPSSDEEKKPAVLDELPGVPSSPGDLPSPSDDADHKSPDRFPSPGYGGAAEQDYEEEDQAFGPGTCRYGGKMYVSAQQIPRDDPCDFCFCFRSDIICLQQSCPPPIHGCHEEPISGFCCPRYECPVSMATTLNVTTTTTTTTTTLPPHFPSHAYKGAAQRRGCHIRGQSYHVGEVVRASSGPCLHCTCGGDGQMKCDPKVCTPEPMLRQMIAAAVSTKRRR